jgi:ribosomal protein S18 acetylase RimI-like enzyme
MKGSGVRVPASASKRARKPSTFNVAPRSADGRYFPRGRLAGAERPRHVPKALVAGLVRHGRQRDPPARWKLTASRRARWVLARLESVVSTPSRRGMTGLVTSSIIRNGSHDDLDAVLALWGSSGALPTVTESVESLRRLVTFDPQAVLVAEAHREVVGSLIAAWNGWRGSFYRLAVTPGQRRRGLATALVREGESRLRERGAVRLDAIVAADEAHAMSFWNAVGYELQSDRSRFVRNF